MKEKHSFYSLIISIGLILAIFFIKKIKEKSDNIIETINIRIIDLTLKWNERGAFKIEDISKLIKKLTRNKYKQDNKKERNEEIKEYE